MKKVEINDYAVGGGDNNNGRSCSLTHLLAQLRAAGIAFKFADPVSGDEIADTVWVEAPNADRLFGMSDEAFDAECERLTAEGFKLEHYDDGCHAVRYAPLSDGGVVLDSGHHATLNGVGYKVAVAIKKEDMKRIEYNNTPPHGV